MDRQEEYCNLLKETNVHLSNIAKEFSHFVAIYATIHNVEVVEKPEGIDNLDETTE